MKSKLPSREENTNPLEIEADRLKEKLDKGEDIFILDVRTQEEHDAWNLSYDKYQKTPVIPIDRIISSHNAVAEQIPKDKEIVTLCAHGQRSQMAAQALSKMGYKVRSIKGGMTAWNQVYDIAEVPLANTTSQDQKRVRIWQLRRVSKGCMSYVISSGTDAAVIDSTCDRDNSVLRLARENGLNITQVIDTHMHADHVSGLASIGGRTGAPSCFGAKEGYKPTNDSGIRVKPIRDGDRIQIGKNGVSLTAVHTPGHTEGSMCYMLTFDSETGKRKSYLFSGDTLFVNGVGRPDLHDKAKEFAADLYNTYHDRLLQYPDDTVLLPAHFDPNSIALKHGELVADTIGSVKGKVKLLSLSKEEFVKFMVSSVPPRPSNYQKIIHINKQLIPCEQINMGDLESGPNSCAVRM